MKTRIRRLYDIANILQSLHLIQKVQITESHGARKPAFEYIGPNVKGLGKLTQTKLMIDIEWKKQLNKIILLYMIVL